MHTILDRTEFKAIQVEGWFIFHPNYKDTPRSPCQKTGNHKFHFQDRNGQWHRRDFKYPHYTIVLPVAAPCKP